MGGNAFKDVQVSKIPQEVYIELQAVTKAAVHKALVKPLTGALCPMGVALNFEHKILHGDLDYIVGIDPPDGDSLKSFVDCFNGAVFCIRDQVSNASTRSFLVQHGSEYYQLDLAFIGRVSTDTFDFWQLWASYGGVGNILGRLARSVGLRLRPTGLEFDLLRDHVLGGHQKDKIQSFFISDYWPEVLGILEMDPQLLDQRLTDITQLYEAVIDSSYFGRSIYEREGSNAINWHRDHKRPIYNDFLAWMENKTLPSAPPKARNLPRLLEQVGIGDDVQDIAQSFLFESSMRSRVVIPAPTPDEYSTHKALRKHVSLKVRNLDLLLLRPPELKSLVSKTIDEFRQLPPASAI